MSRNLQITSTTTHEFLLHFCIANRFHRETYQWAFFSLIFVAFVLRISNDICSHPFIANFFFLQNAAFDSVNLHIVATFHSRFIFTYFSLSFTPLSTSIFILQLNRVISACNLLSESLVIRIYIGAIFGVMLHRMESFLEINKVLTFRNFVFSAPYTQFDQC